MDQTKKKHKHSYMYKKIT